MSYNEFYFIIFNYLFSIRVSMKTYILIKYLLHIAYKQVLDNLILKILFFDGFYWLVYFIELLLTL